MVGTDRAGTLISDLTSFLDECAKNNIFMGLVLFNGAVLTNQDTIDLIWDYSKLETYLAKALTPMVEGLKDHPALGFWEVSHLVIIHYTGSFNINALCISLFLWLRS